MPKPLKYFLIFLAVVCAMVVGYYQFANYAGRKAWAETQAKLKAAGEPVTREEWLSRKVKVPPEENFGAVEPLLGIAEVINGDPDAGEPGAKRQRLSECNPLEKVKGSQVDLPIAVSFRAGGSFDLLGWAEVFSKTDVFEEGEPVPEDPVAVLRKVLEPNQEILEALHKGNTRPHALLEPPIATRFKKEEEWISLALPHFSCILGVAKALRFHWAMATAREDGAEVLKCLVTLMRLAELSNNDDTLIGSMVGASVVAMTDDGVHSFLEEGRYQRVQDLRAIGSVARKLKASMTLAERFRFECLFVEEALDKLGSEHSPYSAINDYREYLYRYGPSGWIDQNKAAFWDAIYYSIIEPEERGLGYAAIDKRCKETVATFNRSGGWINPHTMFARESFGAYTRISFELIYSRTLVTQWITAIELELYYLQNGKYPPSLDELIDENRIELPHDEMGQQAMRYRRTEGGYLLYSIGADGTDDGGKVSLDSTHPERTRFLDEKYKGDWVWEIHRTGSRELEGENP